jgi:RND family efflux transporter MFP subunit
MLDGVLRIADSNRCCYAHPATTPDFLGEKMSRSCLVVLSPIAAMAICACSSHAPAPSGPPPISVTAGRVTRADISTYATFDGQISPVYQTTLSTAQAGTVATVAATEGDFVHKGELLASLDTSQLQAQLKGNRATVRQDEALVLHSTVAAPVASQQYSSAVATAQQNLKAALDAVRTARAALANDALTERADLQLVKRGFVSQTAYTQARASYVSSRETLRTDLAAVPAAQAALQTAYTNTDQRREDQATIAQNQAGLEAARANVELLEAQIAQSSVYAPFDGQVTQRLLDPGAYAGANTPLLAIAQVSRVYVVANVPDVDLPYISRGTTVTFTSSSMAGRRFAGHVFDVNTTPTSGTLSYRVRLLQDNPGLVLRGGMMVSVTAVKAHHADVLLVPVGAIARGPSGSNVFTIENGRAKSVPVRVGLQTDTLAEVRGPGLSTRTTVITTQPNGLQNGSVVNVPGSGNTKAGKAVAAAR